MIDITNLALTLPGGRKLFTNLSWRVPKGEKTGLMGRNGIGKTTLLRLIANKISPDSGTITIAPKGSDVGYLPQDLAELPAEKPLLTFLKEFVGLTKLEEELKEKEAQLDKDSLLQHAILQEAFERAGGWNFEALALKTLAGLGFKPKDSTKRCGDFSGGWKMRISLAALLLQSPSVLLLDEPTNHLDTESMEWLEGRLASYDGTLVVISHDRTFMDKIVTSVAHLDNGIIKTFRGNYSQYLEASTAWEEQLAKEAEAKAEQIAHLQSFVDRFRYKDSKAKQAQQRLKMIDRLGPVEDRKKSYRPMALQFPPCNPSGKKVVTVENLSKSFDELLVFKDLHFEIHRGEKIALVGYNGSGKTTLSRLLTGDLSPTNGTVTLGHNVQMAHFAQQSADNLNYNNTVFEELLPLRPDWSPNQKRGVLGRFNFGDEDLNKKVACLSGGEKSRLALAKLTMTPCNFLVLDEPTNHLDAQTRDLFEQALLAYEGTLLIVSHDRYFLNQLASRVLQLANGTLRDYQGNYDSFLAQRVEEEKTIERKGTQSGKKEQKRLEAERRNELHRLTKDTKNAIEQKELAIEKLEQEKERLETELSTNQDGQAIAALSVEYHGVCSELEKTLSTWETLMEELKAIEEGNEL